MVEKQPEGDTEPRVLDKFSAELDLTLRARAPLVVISSFEEERALRSLLEVCARRNRAVLAWDFSDGFVGHGYSGSVPIVLEANHLLNFIDKSNEEIVFVLKDFHDFWHDRGTRRALRSVCQRLRYSRKSVVILTHERRLPPELRDVGVVLDLPPPSDNDLRGELERLLKVPGVESTLSEEEVTKLLEGARGLTAAQALRVFGKSIVSGGVLSSAAIPNVMEEKKELLRGCDALEFVSISGSSSDIGGLHSLKKWIELRKGALTAEAKAYGLPAPKGVALIGIPGSGKSLSAKMIAQLFGLALLRFDVGALFGSYVGESEEQTREALRLAESVSPCVVWIDEIEKALTQGGAHDGGTSTRVFGTILTWMQERKAPCFVVATANDISKLPPELLRRGRFDEIFFLDLPNEEERGEIFRVHLKKRRREPESYDVAKLSAESAGYVGAEIEMAIIDAMFSAFHEGREFTTDDILDALSRSIPLSLSRKEQIGELRLWLTEGRARSAS